MRHILISGANRGIGLGLAQAYAKAGHTVTGIARKPPEETSEVTWLKADVTNLADLRNAAERTGELDLLVCNAGVYLDRGLDHFATNGDEWANSFAVNVEGVFRTIQAYRNKLKKGAKIAIISSQMGSSERAGGGSYIYRASKAAVANLGANLAVDLKEEGIAVGMFHPGWVQTDMGTDAAAINVETSINGLMARFQDLTLDKTGCFENYDGTHMPF